MLNILMVEDNPGDVVFAKEALAEAGIDHCLHVVGDGIEAMDFLNRRDGFASSPRPDLVILDLNLPRRNGHEVMAELSQDEDLKHIPVAVFTSSRADVNICGNFPSLRCMYAVKTADFSELIEIMRNMRVFASGAQ